MQYLRNFIWLKGQVESLGLLQQTRGQIPREKKKSNIKNNVILAIGLICILHRYLENFKFEPVFFFFNFIVIILFIGSAIFNVHLWVKLIFSKDDALIL